jgi:hypothetical protein
MSISRYPLRSLRDLPVAQIEFIKMELGPYRDRSEIKDLIRDLYRCYFSIPRVEEAGGEILGPEELLDDDGVALFRQVRDALSREGIDPWTLWIRAMRRL